MTLRRTIHIRWQVSRGLGRTLPALLLAIILVLRAADDGSVNFA
jgi:hypothetical protein